MNLDLLIKLVKLANNNPNENEANLAARKVCKMIEENKYSFNNTKVSEPAKRPVGSQGFDPWDIMNDIIKEQKKRSDDSKKYYTDGNTGRENPWGNPFTREWTYPPNPFTNDPKKPKQHEGPLEATDRECSKCGHTFATYNKRTPYLCFACEMIK